MQTYLILNVIILVLVLIAARLTHRRLSWTALLATLGVLLICTAIFDSYIVNADIVLYHEHRILGVYIGYAPVEDFAYALAAGLLMPTLWYCLGKKDGDAQKD